MEQGNVFSNPTQIPEAVQKLVRQYKAEPNNYELIIYGDLVLLYSKTIEKVEGQGFDAVSIGREVSRAYWNDAQFLSLERAKGILGIR